jgi:hypothetical protein
LNASGAQAGDQGGSKFANLFFNYSAPYAPQSLGQYLYWKTADRPAHVPPFELVRDKVEKRWYLDKARPLAQAEADRLAADVKKAGEPTAFNDARLRFGKDVVQLPNVGRLVPPNKDRPTAVVSQEMFSQYQPYQLPEGKLEHAPAGLAEQLLGALKKKGDTLVVADTPEDTFYVAALVREKTEPTENAFYQAYRSPPQALVQQLQATDRTRQEYRTAVIEELRKQAGLTVKEDILKGMERKGGPADDT